MKMEIHGDFIIPYMIFMCAHVFLYIKSLFFLREWGWWMIPDVKGYIRAGVQNKAVIDRPTWFQVKGPRYPDPGDF